MAIKTTKLMHCDQCGKTAPVPDPDAIYGDEFIEGHALSYGEFYRITGQWMDFWVCSTACIRKIAPSIRQRELDYQKKLEDGR
jgi:hypothetical protein